MTMRNRFAAVTVAGLLAAGGMTGTAVAAPSDRAVSQTGGAAGLVAAVVQANVQDVDVDIVDDVTVIDGNVTVENVLNNNRVLQDILNANDIDIAVTDVVDVTIEDNVLVLNVLSTSNIAGLA